MRRTLLLLLIFLLSKSSFAQKVFLEPFGGYQIDINNSKTRLINSGLQLAFVFKKQKYEMLLQVQRSWPQNLHSTDSAFTLHPNLPLYTTAPKTLSTTSFSFAVGHRIKIAGGKTNNSFFIKAFTGIMDQKTTVTYQYDKTNYIILNPDQTIEHTGIYVSGGFEYMRRFAHNRFFAELNFSPPPSGTIKYPSSFSSACIFQHGLFHSTFKKIKNMTLKIHKKVVITSVALLFLFLIACQKNLTVYYSDKDTPGVAIFSNTGNNIFSCFINGQPWKTVSSTSGGFISSTIYEITINLHKSSALMDTLSIVWLGDGHQQSNVSSISLTLPVAKNFNLKSLSALQGKRLIIDSTNGFFSINNTYFFTSAGPRGKGNIYFNTIGFDSTSAYGYYGKISGLMEATIDSLTITSGRFDDTIGERQINYY